MGTVQVALAGDDEGEARLDATRQVGVAGRGGERRGSLERCLGRLETTLFAFGLADNPVQLGAFARVRPVDCCQPSLRRHRRTVGCGMDELDEFGDVRNVPHAGTLRRRARRPCYLTTSAVRIASAGRMG